MNSTTPDAIFVTKYSDTDNLVISTKEYKGIVVTREGRFLGMADKSKTAIFNEEYIGYCTMSSVDVRNAIKDFLEKENKSSLVVSVYTGDKECKDCFFVSSSNEMGRVINYKTKEHIGFALCPRSSMTYKLGSNHPCMRAIEKYLSTKKGSLCENSVTVMRYEGDERYKHHVFVMIRTLCFVVDSKTRQVVGYVQNSAGKVLEKKVDKIFFEGLSFSLDFYSVVDSFLAGKRNPDSRLNVLRKHLEPFEKTYFEFKDKGNIFPAICRIVTTIDDEVMAEIREIYPTVSDGKSITAAMDELFC